jgi:general secretion pathway protein A
MTITLEMDGLARSPILEAARAAPEWIATRTHNEALAAIAAAVQFQKGYASVLGEAGSGKTTLLRAYAAHAWRGDVRAVLVDGRCGNYVDFVRSVLRSLRINTDGKDERWLRRRLQLAAQLHRASGRLLAVLIDDADALGDKVLSQLHLLIDSSAGQESVLQIVLAGTPELEKRLRHAVHAPINQRLGVRTRLTPLAADERARLVQSIFERESVETAEELPSRTVRRIVRKSRGNPGQIATLTREAIYTTLGSLSSHL